MIKNVYCCSKDFPMKQIATKISFDKYNWCIITYVCPKCQKTIKIEVIE